MDQISYFKTLPLDFLKEEILSNFSVDDIISLCNTEKYFKQICDYQFWEKYIMKNFNDNVYEIEYWDDKLYDNKSITLALLAKAYEKGKPILLTKINSTFITLISVTIHMTLFDIFDIINEIIPNTDKLILSLRIPFEDDHKVGIVIDGELGELFIFDINDIDNQELWKRPNELIVSIGVYNLYCTLFEINAL